MNLDQFVGRTIIYTDPPADGGDGSEAEFICSDVVVTSDSTYGYPPKVTFQLNVLRDENGVQYRVKAIPGLITLGAQALRQDNDGDLYVGEDCTQPRAKRLRKKAEAVLRGAGVLK